MKEVTARKIKSWLVLNGIRQVDIAKKMGVTPTMVRSFIAGRSTSLPLYMYFVSLGCPKTYFADRPEARRAS